MKTGTLLRIIRDRFDRGRPSALTPWGFRLAGHREMASGSFEINETRLVRDLLSDVDILVNVGANIGYYCCHALSLGKPVIAFEPIYRNLHYLLRNLLDNGWADQVEVWPIALGAQASLMRMWGCNTGASLVKGWASMSDDYVTSVPVHSLDRVLGATLEGLRPLVLIDVEGAEYDVLTGASRLLCHQPRPIWLVEISYLEHQPVDRAHNPYFLLTFDIFFKAGYSCWVIDATNGLKTPVEPADLTHIMSGDVATKGHNYLFC